MTTEMQPQGLDLNNPNQQTQEDGPVECLGKTFDSDQARRDYYLALLTEKLKDPEFRKIEGFPIGDDEDILELSDPPYYTACPNPFIEDFIKHFGRPYDPAEEYKREPYAADVSEGKNHPIYNAHSYHTKVPHKAIMRYILHYTNPDDVVFDGFCGTGMTGLAAQLCGNKEIVESLGYKVLPDGQVLQETEAEEGAEKWREWSSLGSRRPVLNDLSPTATFIANNYNSQFFDVSFKKEAQRILEEVRLEHGWMFGTLHSDGKTKVLADYTVWSEVFHCPECANEVVFLKEALCLESREVKKDFPCPHCQITLTKKGMERVLETYFDQTLNESCRRPKREAVLIAYRIGKDKYEKQPDDYDFEILSKIDKEASKLSFTTAEFPFDQMWEAPRIKNRGVSHVHQLFIARTQIVLESLWNKVNQVDNYRTRQNLRFWLDQSIWGFSVLNRYRLRAYSHVNQYMSGVYYIPSQFAESSPWYNLSGKLDRLPKAFSGLKISGSFCGSTSSSTKLALPDETVDYAFIDPPFGDNIPYSELNFVVETWLGVKTHMRPEAIVDRSKKDRSAQKSVLDYMGLIEDCFREIYRILKPGRWMTVEFSNTSAGVWNAIQTSLGKSGFIIGNVSALDKKQGSFKAVTTPTAVKQDLVISAYKPNGGFEDRFVNESDEEGIWDFVRTHLGYLPVTKEQYDELVKVPERDPRILFDQVVSYFVRNLRDVPVSSKEFQEGLLERFAERDGMIFLPEQVAEYDKARVSSKQLRQLSIFVDDEASAIEWLRQLLNQKPQSYQDIHPKFINELSGWKKAEEQLELSKLLEQNFIKYDGEGPLPPQIHSYLSTNFKEMRNLPKDDLQLIKKAKDRWYVPNPEREEDLQKLRERDLLKQFEEYKTHTGRKLKTVRMEAVRCGFKKAWQERDYPTIIQVAEKIPQNLLQEDQKLLMWYDQAQTRHSDESLF